jgi:hypothetical protein
MELYWLNVFWCLLPTSSAAQGNDDSIKVFVRIRPLGGGSGTAVEVSQCFGHLFSPDFSIL